MKLQVQQVGKIFDGRGRAVKALENIDLGVSEGEFICLIGPSGCGKSTLLAMLAGLEFPTEGTVLADGEPITGPDPRRVLIFQDAALFPWLDVHANVTFGLHPKRLPKAEKEAIVDRLLRMVHLEHFHHAWVHELSGGMKQRVALARALAVDPAVLLLDEPFGSLDAITRGVLHGELQDVWLNTGKTIVFVTHNVREAVVLGDRVVVMSPRPGRIVAEHKIALARPRQIGDEPVIELAHRIAADLRLSEEAPRSVGRRRERHP